MVPSPQSVGVFCCLQAHGQDPEAVLSCSTEVPPGEQLPQGLVHAQAAGGGRLLTRPLTRLLTWLLDLGASGPVGSSSCPTPEAGLSHRPSSIPPALVPMGTQNASPPAVTHLCVTSCTAWSLWWLQLWSPTLHHAGFRP